MSPLARAAWIETIVEKSNVLVVVSRRSQERRGLKLSQSMCWTASLVSPLARAAWIETSYAIIIIKEAIVAARKSGVD